MPYTIPKRTDPNGQAGKKGTRTRAQREIASKQKQYRLVTIDGGSKSNSGADDGSCKQAERSRDRKIKNNKVILKKRRGGMSCRKSSKAGKNPALYHIARG